MTGAGTFGDPYVVSTWAELLSVATDDNVYIKCADNCTWDFNNIEPEGLTPATIRCRELDGNGVELRNINFHNTTDYGITFTRNGGSQTVKNINIINAYVHDTSTALILFSDRPEMKSFQISALVKDAQLIFGTSTSKFGGMNVKSVGSSTFATNSEYEWAYVGFENCIIKLDGESTKAISEPDTYNIGVKFKDCKFIGNNPYTSLYGVYDTVDVDMTLTGDEFDEISNPTFLLVNKSKTTTPTDLPDSVYALTASQLADVSYLQGIGFPVV